MEKTLTKTITMDTPLTDPPPVGTTQTNDAPVSNPHILPLRYWCLSVAMAIVFVGVIAGWQYNLQYHEVPPAVDYNIERLKTPTKGLHIITLGDSYSRSALPFDERLEKMALEKELSFKYTRFTKNYGKQEHFAVLLPHILEAKPDFVFLLAEPFLIGYQKTVGDLLVSFRNGVRSIKNKILGQKSRKLDIFHNSGGGEIDKTDNWVAKPEMVKNRLEWVTERLFVFTPKMPEAYEEFFKAAEAQGTRVVLLDIGHSKVLKAAFPPEFNTQVTSNLAKLGARYQVDVWKFPSTLPLTHFSDVAHLNLKGQRVFVNWFLGRLGDAVKKND
jgi:hypothetical protein